MKNNFYLLLFLFLLFGGCQEQRTTKHETVKSTINSQPKKSEKHTFHFQNLNNTSLTLEVKNDVYNFKNIKQSIVMITLFSTWCPPCRGEIPHLSNLQKKFKENLFILSALVYDDISNKNLSKFMTSEKMNFFLSSKQRENLKFSTFIGSKLGLSKNFTLPLMILFVEGKYFTHYEGSMPEEMIESDINQALKQLKTKNKR